MAFGTGSGLRRGQRQRGPGAVHLGCPRSPWGRVPALAPTCPRDAAGSRAPPSCQARIRSLRCGCQLAPLLPWAVLWASGFSPPLCSPALTLRRSLPSGSGIARCRAKGGDRAAEGDGRVPLCIRQQEQLKGEGQEDRSRVGSCGQGQASRPEDAGAGTYRWGLHLGHN